MSGSFMLFFPIMPTPEGEFNFDDLLREIKQEDTYDAALVGNGLSEIYRSGKYASFIIPEGVSAGARTVNAVHMAANTEGSVNLLEFIPDSSPEYQETLRRLLREQLAAFDPLAEISGEELAQAIWLATHENLYVFGAFQLATRGDGRRSTEIYFPKSFAQLTNSIEHAVTISAALVRYAQ